MNCRPFHASVAMVVPRTADDKLVVDDQKQMSVLDLVIEGMEYGIVAAGDDKLGAELEVLQ